MARTVVEGLQQVKGNGGRKLKKERHLSSYETSNVTRVL